MRIALFVFCAAIFFSCKNEQKSSPDLAAYVDQFIGTGFHGHVFMGANVPFGAVQLGPVNLTEGWDWCSGYHYSDSTIIGFSHTHLSGTGIGDLGDIMLMPVTGEVPMKKGMHGDPASGWYSLFSHNEETARPGYYAVDLKRYGVKVELTATERVGFHQYTFPASDDAKIIVDLKQGIGWDKPTRAMIRKVNDTTIEGYRYSTGWAKDQRIYFTAIFSKPMTAFAVYSDTVRQTGPELDTVYVKGVVHFSTESNEMVRTKVGISPVSTKNALENINAEIPHWEFKDVADSAYQAWNHELKKIDIRTSDTAKLKNFYTALYHTMIAPSIFNDHNGDYLGTDKKVYHAPSFTNLTTFSLWDTYRGANPLYTIYQQKRSTPCSPFTSNRENYRYGI
jgi:predicted alpha-1,2-mannosidase